jgi:mono/diheme cytochrome c family protein
MKKVFAVACGIALTSTMAFSADLKDNPNFKAKCAMCHGAAAEGKPGMKTAPLKDAAAKPAAELTATITKGKGKMPAYDGKLQAADITSLVNEIKALK